MPEFSQYVPATPHHADPEQRREQPGGNVVGRAGMWFFAIASLLLLGLSAVVAWRWLDANLLHWGVADGKTQQVNHAELLERVRAFELATVKHTYAGQEHVEAGKILNAGPARVALPSFIAGQKLDVTGNVIITAGVDLSKVKPEDMEITRQGRDVRVLIHVPAPEILSAELVPNTLDLSTSAGLVTRLGQSVGIEEKDLRDRAADQVVLVAKERAVEQGILDDAAYETERRLRTFLQSLPQTGDERVTYDVDVRPPSGQ